jgi:RND family efflux transporter MFP subunit
MKFLKNPKSIIIISIAICVGIISFTIFRVSDKKNVPIGTTPVKLANLIEEVKTTGKVKPSQNIDLAFESGGKVTSINFKNGDKVSSGDVIATIGNIELEAKLKQAQTAFESEKINLEKLRKPATVTKVTQAENALQSAKDGFEKLKLSQDTNYKNALDAKQKASDNVIKAYEDSFNSISAAFLDLPTIITRLNDIFYSSEIGESEPSIGGDFQNFSALYNHTDERDKDKLAPFQTSAENAYKEARVKYNANSGNYKNTTRYTDNATIESLLAETIETTKAMAQAAKSEKNYIDNWVDLQEKRDWDVIPKVTEYQTELSTYIGKIDGYLSSLLAVQRVLQDNLDIIDRTERDLYDMDKSNPLDLAFAQATVVEKENILKDLKDGADSLDIQLQENKIEQAEAAMEIIQSGMSKTVLISPFSGIIAKEDLTLGQLITQNQSVATLISQSKFQVEASISEVDIAKIKIGNNAVVTLDPYGSETFDAVLTAIDQAETVVNGIQTYQITLQFTKDDDRIKSGMTANVKIETATKEHVIAVPEASIITKDNKKYVLVDNGTTTTQETATEEREIQVGIKGSNGLIEILSGLNEGEKIVNFGGAQ